MTRIEVSHGNGSTTTDTLPPPVQRVTRPPALADAPEPSPLEQQQQHLSAWVVYSAIVALIAGGSRVLDAIWALRYNGAVPDNLQGAVLGTSLTTYGWVWLGVGCMLILGGIGLFLHSSVARWFAIFAAGIGAWTAVTWMAFYPVWSLVYVGAALLVIYGLIVHWERQQVS